jgi:arginyl-tRNA synthetase
MTQSKTLYAAHAALIETVLAELVTEGVLPAQTSFANVTLEPPRDPAHGDLATNAAMVLAKGAGMNPRALAEAITAKLTAHPSITSAEIAGPGFINLRLQPQAWLDELRAITELAGDYGRSEIGAGRLVNVEYVSANPTGPMHMGHCRGAVVGDALASLLEWAGHEVIREYYINDAGGQVDVLARSAHLRYREALGDDIGAIPAGLYPGDYLKPVGAALASELGERFKDAPEAEWLPIFRAEAVARMMDLIKGDLAMLGIHHDVFSSEAALQAAGKPEAAEAWLRQHDLV